MKRFILPMQRLLSLAVIATVLDGGLAVAQSSSAGPLVRRPKGIYAFGSRSLTHLGVAKPENKEIMMVFGRLIGIGGIPRADD